MELETKVIEIQVNGQTRFAPVYVIDGMTCEISHQGQLINFDNENDAIEYLDDEN